MGDVNYKTPTSLNFQAIRHLFPSILISLVCFFIGKNADIHAFKSGRLYLGINDENTHDNEGWYRLRIHVIE